MDIVHGCDLKKLGSLFCGLANNQLQLLMLLCLLASANDPLHGPRPNLPRKRGKPGFRLFIPQCEEIRPKIHQFAA
jgi:hypothetical protein